MSDYNKIKKCPFCKEQIKIEIIEIYWEERGWIADFCCYELQEDIKENNSFISEIDMYPILKNYMPTIRRLTNTLQFDYKITIEAIDFKTMREYVSAHHRHNKPPVGWKFGYGAYNGAKMVGVVSVGRPVARAYNGICLEVNRVAINDMMDREDRFYFNACSKLYAAAAKKTKKLGYKKLITYIRSDENGASVRAANFKHESFIRGRKYIRDGIDRNLEAIDKNRYSITF